MNVGTFEGGNTVNSVPDAASFGVDIRTVPGMDHAALRAKLQASSAARRSSRCSRT